MPGGALDFGQKNPPLVTSIHHQSVNELGANFRTVATSMDRRVIEAISHTRYRNVYGVQFHPESPFLYKRDQFLNAKNQSVTMSADDRSFLERFWRDFSSRLINNH